MNMAAVPENPYPPRPAVIYATLNAVAVVGLIAMILTAPFRAPRRSISSLAGAAVTWPFSRRTRRLARERPSSVSYFGTAA